MVNSFVNLVKSLQIDGLRTAEVGVWDGTSTMNYLPHVVNMCGHSYAIDWFKGNPKRNNIHNENQDKRDDEFFDVFCNNVSRYREYLTILRGHSSNMAELIPDRSLDICFIDGDHRYWQVMADIELYLPKVKIGGILCGHDHEFRGSPNQFSAKQLYMSVQNFGGHIGVIQAVNDCFGEDYKLIGDTVWMRHVTGSEEIRRI